MTPAPGGRRVDIEDGKALALADAQPQQRHAAGGVDDLLQLDRLPPERHVELLERRHLGHNQGIEAGARRRAYHPVGAVPVPHSGYAAYPHGSLRRAPRAARVGESRRPGGEEESWPRRNTTPRCSIASDVSAKVSQEAFKALKAGIQMVTAPHTPVPFSSALEDLYLPSADKIATAVRKTMAN